MVFMMLQNLYDCRIEKTWVTLLLYVYKELWVTMSENQ